VDRPFQKTYFTFTIGFFLLTIFFSSCKKFKEEELTGLWEEHWEKGTDVINTDTIEITTKDKELIIALSIHTDTRIPVYSNISFDGSDLSFKMNVNAITNSYSLTISNDGNTLSGDVDIWRNEKRHIEWKRIKK
jgi:hypothetical protein